MAYPIFPSIKPPDMNGGIQPEDYSPLRRTEFEGNTASVRRRSVKTRKRWTVKWSKLPQADYDELRLFFSERQGGPFTWHNGADGYQYTVVFSDDKIQASSVMYDGATASIRYSVQIRLEEYAGDWQFAVEDSDDGDGGYSVVLRLSVSGGQEVSFTHDSSCAIDWGDGTTETGSSFEETHEYSTAGDKTLTITLPAGLTELNLSGLGFSLVEIVRFRIPASVTSFKRMFKGTALRHLPAYDLHHYGITDVEEEFDGCLLLESLGGLTNPDTVVTATAQFYNCISLKRLNVFYNGNGVTACDSQFQKCASLREIPDAFRNGPVTVTMANQFNGCKELEIVPFWNVYPQGKTALAVNFMFNGCGKLTGYVPPERTWQSRRTFGHSQFAAPFLNCTRLDNYYSMPKEWSGTDFATQTITTVFVDNSGVRDSTVSGTFTFHLYGDEGSDNDVSCTVSAGVGANVSLIRGGEYEVIPPLGFAKVFRYRSAPATALADRTVDADATFIAGALVNSVELLAIPNDTRILYKCRAGTYMKQRPLFYHPSATHSYSINWGDGQSSTGSGTGSLMPEHTYSATGEYLVLMRATNSRRFMLTLATANASTDEAYSNTKYRGLVVAELCYFGFNALTEMFRTFMGCQFTRLPDGFSIPNTINDWRETFYGVPLAEIPETAFPETLSGTKNVQNMFRMPDGVLNDCGEIPASKLWGASGVTWSNKANCFTGHAYAENYAAAVSNGWAADISLDAPSEASAVDALADSMETQAASLASTLENDGLDADSNWSPVAASIESLLSKARECLERSWRHLQAGNMLPPFAYQWTREEGVAVFHTPLFAVSPGTTYTLSVTGGYKAMVRGYDANGNVIEPAEYAIADNDTVTWTPVTAVQARVALGTGTAGDEFPPTQGILDMANPRMEVAQ